MFTNGRSGSNLVVDCLNQHPAVVNYGEVLGVYMPSMQLHDRLGYGGSSAETYLDHVLTSRSHFEIARGYSVVTRLRRGERPRRKRWGDLASVGIKDLAIRFAEREVSDYLAERPDIRVISLHRENTLRRVVSLMSMERTGVHRVASTEEGGRARIRFEIDLEELVHQLKILEQEKVDQLAVVDRLDPERCLRLVYEDLVATPDSIAETMRDVFRFLGVEPIEVEQAHQRILDRDLSRTVVNYGDLVHAVDAAGFGQYLES